MDYAVDLGAILACNGVREKAPWAASEARDDSIRGQVLPGPVESDDHDKAHDARVLLAETDTAFAYPPDSGMDTDGHEREKAKPEPD